MLADASEFESVEAAESRESKVRVSSVGHVEIFLMTAEEVKKDLDTCLDSNSPRLVITVVRLVITVIRLRSRRTSKISCIGGRSRLWIEKGIQADILSV